MSNLKPGCMCSLKHRRSVAAQPRNVFSEKMADKLRMMHTGSSSSLQQ